MELNLSVIYRLCTIDREIVGMSLPFVLEICNINKALLEELPFTISDAVQTE